MLKTPISYYGGKLNMVNKIVPLLDYRKNQFVSAFVGGAAVEMAKAKHKVEVWNDYDARVINFWMTMQDEEKFEQLAKMIKMTLHHEYIYKHTMKIIKDSEFLLVNDIYLAWAFWVQTNMSYSNALHNGFAHANDNSRNLQTANKRESFRKAFYDRVRLIQMFYRDGVELIKMKDSEDTTFFLDPPYVDSKCAHYEGMFGHDDMKRLLDVLGGLKGTFLMTSYPYTKDDVDGIAVPVLEDYRKEFGWESHDETYPLSVYGKREEQKFKTECITMNYRIQAKLDLFSKDEDDD